MTPDSIRVLLVDDHAIVLEGYRRLLDRAAGIAVVAEAADSRAGYQRYKDEQPDVAVIDLSMPGRGGIDLIGQILAWDAAARIVVFSMHQDPAFVLKAFQAGARGYVTKSSKPALLVEAIREVAAGRRLISPDVSQDLALARVGGGAGPFDQLSPREFEILQHLLRARSSDDIAATLNLSPKTVANYHSLIKQKLGVNSDMELLYLGLREGLVTAPAAKG
jgi:two-component system, NarL family, invasion response regulator UvrY